MNKFLNLFELNEINFDLIKKYVEDNPGKYEGLEQLFRLKQFQTKGEDEYSNIEPWIQWVSVHTAKTFSEHKVFRLGDIVKFSGEQIFERLEKRGCKVGCVSPMNTDNRLKNPSFFIPDPWTDTHSDGSKFSRWIHRTLRQTVNDNSKEKIELASCLYLLICFIYFAQVQNYKTYLSLFLKRKRRWNKALFLDLFLSDVFIKYTQKRRANFCTLFLNGFAHIQHHYFLSSVYYKGNLENFSSYIQNCDDPIHDAINVYDKIILQLLNKIRGNKIFATGLQQIEVKETQLYYRLRDHKKFLQEIGISNFSVEPRMTRDFKITFADSVSQKNAVLTLRTIQHFGLRVFGEVDVRDDSVFVTLTYNQPLKPNEVLNFNERNICLNDSFVFVAFKNGRHETGGYGFIDYSPKILMEGDKPQHVRVIGQEVVEFFN